VSFHRGRSEATFCLLTATIAAVLDYAMDNIIYSISFFTEHTTVFVVSH
jgi:hypothetical protein